MSSSKITNFDKILSLDLKKNCILNIHNILQYLIFLKNCHKYVFIKM